MKKIYFKIFILFSLVFALLLQFQNCAKKEPVFSDARVTEALSFFGYRYDKPTPIYFEIEIIPESSDATHQTYKLMVFAANSDRGNASIDYEFEVFDSGNTSICPLKTGSLSAGTSLVEENCIALKTAVLGKAVLKVRNPGDDWEVFEKSYISE